MPVFLNTRLLSEFINKQMTIQTLTFDIYKHNGYLYRRTKCNVKWNVSSLDLQNSQV